MSIFTGSKLKITSKGGVRDVQIIDLGTGEDLCKKYPITDVTWTGTVHGCSAAITLLNVELDVELDTSKVEESSKG